MPARFRTVAVTLTSLALCLAANAVRAESGRYVTPTEPAYVPAGFDQVGGSGYLAEYLAAQAKAKAEAKAAAAQATGAEASAQAAPQNAPGRVQTASVTGEARLIEVRDERYAAR